MNSCLSQHLSSQLPGHEHRLEIPSLQKRRLFRKATKSATFIEDPYEETPWAGRNPTGAVLYTAKARQAEDVNLLDFCPTG